MKTKTVKIRATTKKRLDKYIASCEVRVVLGDVISIAVEEWLDKMSGGKS